MLNALLNRFRAKPPPPAVPRAGSGPPGVRCRSPHATPDAAPLAGAGARRPLVSAQGRLAGFEFQVGAAMLSRLQGPAASAYTTNLLGAMRLCCHQSLGALAELPASWLAQGAQDRDLARGMHLLLRADALFEDTEATCALISRLRRAGVLVGWSPRSTPAMPRAAGRPDFMPLPAPATPDATAWQQAVHTAANAGPRCRCCCWNCPRWT